MQDMISLDRIDVPLRLEFGLSRVELGVIDPILGSVECQRKCRELRFVHLFVQLQKYSEACLCENDMGGVWGNVVLTDVSDIGRPEAIRGQPVKDSFTEK